ncbi:Protein transport protein HofC-like protein, partial [human gut metagenome]
IRARLNKETRNFGIPSFLNINKEEGLSFSSSTLAIANKLLMRRPTWLIVRQKLLLRIPIMGSLMRGQKLTQIFTILALTQSAGITFLQG